MVRVKRSVKLCIVCGRYPQRHDVELCDACQSSLEGLPNWPDVGTYGAIAWAAMRARAGLRAAAVTEARLKKKQEAALQELREVGWAPGEPLKVEVIHKSHIGRHRVAVFCEGGRITQTVAQLVGLTARTWGWGANMPLQVILFNSKQSPKDELQRRLEAATGVVIDVR